MRATLIIFSLSFTFIYLLFLQHLLVNKPSYYSLSYSQDINTIDFMVISLYHPFDFITFLISVRNQDTPYKKK